VHREAHAVLHGDLARRFIADADNSLDWLFTRKRESDGPLSYGEFIAGVGAMAMGATRADETTAGLASMRDG
jgi:hypothetical protein